MDRDWQGSSSTRSALRSDHKRAMARAALLGSHTHDTASGQVHIWVRDGKFLARGSLRGRRFGHLLGADQREAQLALRSLLGDMDRGTFERATERPHQTVQTGAAPKLTPPELVNLFIADVRRRKGKDTAVAYQDRLLPGVEFWDQNRRRWPRAENLDRSFATEFKAYLFGRQVTPNGRPLAAPRRISPGQVVNILACWGTMLHWASRPEIRLLPPGFVSPFTHELIGQRPRRDPLAPPTIPLELRIAMVKVMDVWQLLTLSFSLILPPRPEEFSGLLVSEVDCQRRELCFGTRCAGDDSTKAGVAFRTPYPKEFDGIVAALIAGRPEGPLLRARRVVVDGKLPRTIVGSADEMQLQFDRYLAKVPPKDVTCAQDRKRYFRRFLRQLGGISADTMAKEFQRVLAAVRPGMAARFYDCRGSVTTDLKDAGVDHITRMYLTGHALSKEILAAYESQRLVQHTSAYFRHIEPLLVAVHQRAAQLGIVS